MNYELARRLDDAKFPLPKSGGWIRNPDKAIESVATPSLSELITDCGDKFESLDRGDFGKDTGILWRAYMTGETFEATNRDYECVHECCGYTSGETPEEAVALLWLELNS